MCSSLRPPWAAAAPTLLRQAPRLPAVRQPQAAAQAVSRVSRVDPVRAGNSPEAIGAVALVPLTATTFPSVSCQNSFKRSLTSLPIYSDSTLDNSRSCSLFFPFWTVPETSVFGAVFRRAGDDSNRSFRKEHQYEQRFSRIMTGLTDRGHQAVFGEQ